jgi:hypothetical protein
MAGVSHFSAISSTFSKLTKDCTNDVTLTAQEAVDVGIFVPSAVAAAGKALIFPSAINGKVLFVNNTDADGALTIKVTGQSGVAIAATKSAILYCNGTDFVRLTADA